MNKVFILPILFTLFSAVYAQSEIESVVLKGLDQFYNFNLDEAKETFKKTTARYPDDPRAFHGLSAVYLWTFLSSKDEMILKEFLKYSDLCIDKAEKLMNKKNGSKVAASFLSAAYTYRAIAFGRSGNYLDAVLAIKKSESYSSESLANDSSNYDAYLGLGIFNFTMGQIPSALKWALNLAGLRGDYSTGAKYIKIAAGNGKYLKVDAQYYLSQILVEQFIEYDEAETLLRRLIRKYPKNLLFDYSLAVVLTKKRSIMEAENILIPLTAKEDSSFKQIIAFSNFLLGDIYFKKNEFEKAKQFYSSFLKMSADSDYVGIARFRLGICFELLDDRESAVTQYALAKNGNMDLEDDIYAKRKSEIYLKRTFADTEISVIISHNLIETGHYKASYDTLSRLLPAVKSEKLRAETYLYLSEAAYGLENFEESLNYALLAKGINQAEEKWVKPFAHYYAAKASVKMKEPRKADEYLNGAEKFSDYDYQNKLQNLVNALRQKI